MKVVLDRRTFLKTAAAGGALLLGIHLPGCREERGASASLPGSVQPVGFTSTFAPNAWLQVNDDGTVVVQVAASEMGQGVMTAIPMLVAEELEADWQRVRVEFAPARAEYANPLMGNQATGGSTAIRGFFQPLREAGAMAREMLVAAAAARWGVAPGSCRADRGEIIHLPSGRRLGFGELASEAARQPLPEQVRLKESGTFRLLGTPVPRMDTPAKVNGSAVFGQDVRVPGMLFASIERCPWFRGKAVRVEAGEALRLPGVVDVQIIDAGVAVLAESTWAAFKGRSALQVQWSPSKLQGLDSGAIRARLQKALDRPKPRRNEGNVDKAFRAADRTIEAEFALPYQAHACMEPMNCTAQVGSGECTVWAPTQAPGRTQQTAARITGLPPDRVRVVTTFLGGGFGRRSEQDFVEEAVELARRTGRPVQVAWSREDDIRHDFYRPASHSRLRAALDTQGRPIAWHQITAGPGLAQGGIDIPYAIPNLRLEQAVVEPGVPVGFWRAVGASNNAFPVECFMDELAAAAGRDPFEFRRDLLADARPRAVLELAAQKAGWGRHLPPGQGRGIALYRSFGSFVAQVAEVSVEGERVRVRRIVCAVDCGVVVNPNTVEAQMESGIVYGLTAALESAITVRDGAVAQSNFHDFPLLRFDAMPQVEVHIVPSGEAPGGIGEPGTPPAAAAVANAIFAATGQRIRALPIRLGA